MRRPTASARNEPMIVPTIRWNVFFKTDAASIEEGYHETTRHVIKTHDPCGYGSVGWYKTKKDDVVKTRLIRSAKPNASA